MKYRPEIDGLRAVAVLPVILFHAGFSTFSGGFVGVDVFFVISGYLITSIILKDLAAGTFSFWEFYERRVRRILPALFFVIICCTPFAWMWMMPMELKAFSTSVVAVSVFMSNILFWRQSGYFDQAAELKPLLHTWSLAVEEQFYIFFPIAMLILWRFGRKNVVGAIAVVALVSLALSEYGSRYHPSFNFYWLPTRAWELAAGSLCAFLAIKPKAMRDDLLSVVGLLAILVAVFYYDQTTPFPSLYALLPVLGTCAIILFARQGTIVGSLLSLRAFVGIGLISYSAYLWHQPLFAFARIRSLTEPTWQLMLLLAVCSLVLAYFSWRYIEVPARKRGAWPMPQRIAVFALSGLFASLLIVFGLFGHFTKGFEGQFVRTLKGDIGHLEFHQFIDNTYVDCQPYDIAQAALTWEGFLRCKQTRQGEADWVLLGDSHAEQLFIGLAEENPDENIVFYIFGGKPYVDDQQFEHIFRFLLDRNLSPKLVLLTMHYKRATSVAEDQRKLLEVVDLLKSAGHTVVLLGDVPKFPVLPERCVYSDSRSRGESVCRIQIEDFIADQKVFETVLQQTASTADIPYITLHEPLCFSGYCTMIIGDEVVYRDDNHLNIIGSKLIGRYLSGKLEKLPTGLNR